MSYPWRVTIMPDYQPGDPAPEGYLRWHEWAGVQHKAGLRQKRCSQCCLWKFPQQLSDQTVTHTAHKRDGTPVERTLRVCRECAARDGATAAP